MNQEEYEYFTNGEQIFGAPFVLDQRLRSRIIYNAILVDNVIEKIIITHFCRETDQQALFASLIFRDGRIDFSRKIIMLDKLLQSAYPDLHTQCKWIIKKIDQIREIRNEFAHSQTTVPIEEAVKQAQGKPVDGITLEYLKNGKVVYKTISTKEALGYMDRALALTIVLNHLHSEIENRISTGKKGGFNVDRTLRVVNNVYRYASLRKPT
jgi:hypothetical protein